MQDVSIVGALDDERYGLSRSVADRCLLLLFTYLAILSDTQSI
jgi:hypothetical protein